MRTEDNREKYKEYDHQYYIKHRRPNSKIGKLETKISDLEAKLAEHNEYFRSFSCKNFNEFQDFISTFMLTPHEEQTLIREIKQQLAEKEKAISNLNGLVRERDKQIKNLKTNKKRVIEHKNKTKISFALEQLEKVRNNLKKVPITDYDFGGNFEKMYKQDAIRQIDNQIKQLREMK